MTSLWTVAVVVSLQDESGTAARHHLQDAIEAAGGLVDDIEVGEERRLCPVCGCWDRVESLCEEPTEGPA